MSIAKLLQQHQKSLEEARKTLERPRVGEADLRLGEALKKRRIAEVSARIAALEAERKAATERIDLAIGAEKETLAALEKAFSIPQDAGGGGGRVEPAKPDRKTPSDKTTPAKPVPERRIPGRPAAPRSTGRTPTRPKRKT